jgi:hypothetical protein
MARNTTRPTDSTVAAYLDGIQNLKRREGCDALVAVMSRVTGAPAKMWGTSIVGFGRYHYRYDSGREGDAALAGFSSRTNGIAVYLAEPGANQAALLARLGRHRMGQACLTIPDLSQVDLDVLERLVADSVQAVRERHGEAGA